MASLPCAQLAWPQTGDLAPVVSKPVSRTVELPGEFQPFLSVSLHAKVPGYVERILVDRGSRVKDGQLLAELSAPEMAAQIAEAESKVQAPKRTGFRPKRNSPRAQSTYDRLKKAAETPGAIAGNELIQAEKQVEAAQALVRSRQQASRAAEAAVNAQKEMQSYLRITAPFDGVVTERLVHPGALVGPGAESGASGDPADLATETRGCGSGGVCRRHHARGQSGISGSRVSGADVLGNSGANRSRARSEDPHDGGRVGCRQRGRFARAGNVSDGQVAGPALAAGLFVPKTSVVTTTERTFVVRNQNGRAEWVDVRKGAADGDLIEVTREPKAGDMVVRRATDEMREGTPLQSEAKR